MILKCPFCGRSPTWLSKPMNFGTGASGMKAPMRALGCDNSLCTVRPATAWRDTQEWKQDKGYLNVNYDNRAIQDWNSRA